MFWVGAGFGLLLFLVFVLAYFLIEQRSDIIDLLNGRAKMIRDMNVMIFKFDSLNQDMIKCTKLHSGLNQKVIRIDQDICRFGNKLSSLTKDFMLAGKFVANTTVTPMSADEVTK